MIALALSVLLSQSAPVHKIVMPPLTLRCDSACMERVWKARTRQVREREALKLLGGFISDKYIVCPYKEPGVVWVRDAVGTGGECKPIKLPAKKRTGWK